MSTRVRLALAAGVLLSAGCGEGFNDVPVRYVQSQTLYYNQDDFPALKDKASLKGKPKLQAAVTKAMEELYGPNPRRMKVPAGLKLPKGGAHLASHFIPGDDPQAPPKKLKWAAAPGGGETVGAGGYALYRRHCLHCHGLSGDGNGPTAPFLFPRPRDYRLGKFKFTSANGNKPTRADLKKTIEDGLAHTSMPAFRGLMNNDEIEQVIDYVIFLSARGESELALINTASIAEEDEAATIFADTAAAEAIQVVLDGWNEADSQVLDPPAPRVASTHESVIRGRTLFLGRTSQKLECAGCHGSKARGDGPSWIDPATFNEVVFGGSSDPKRFERLREIADKAQKKWNDDWGDPLRPNDLNRGIYKGGRRPIDIYWRVAKGITGTPMPGHASALKPEEIWDIVNFVLALPYEPELLEGIPSAPADVAASH